MTPNCIDGLTIYQRKVVYALMKLGDSKAIKLTELTGMVMSMTSCDLGESTIYNAIISLGQNYVGSNNVNLLEPIGQFGTRYYNGKDSSPAKYLSTSLSTLANLLYPQ